MVRARRALGTWLAMLGCLLAASSARAGDPDALSQITPRPSGSSLVGVASIYGGQGLLYSKDGGETFSALCSSMASEPGVDSSGQPATLHPAGYDPAVITHDGFVLVADPYGLWMDDGQGCGWKILPELRDISISDLTLDAVDSDTVYGVTAEYQADNGLFRRSSDGTVERIGTQEPIMLYRVRTAALPEGGRRIYVSGVREQVPVVFSDGGFEIIELVDGGLPPISGAQIRSFYIVRYSDDGGETWTTHDIGPTLDSQLYLEAVDPSNPDRIVVALRRYADNGAPAELDTILVSEDRGETFSEWLAVSELGGVAFAPNGEVWIGEHGEGAQRDTRGLFHAASVLDPPQRIADYEVWCLNLSGETLEICQRLDWGTADRATGEFTKKVSIKELDTIHTCEGLDTVAACRNDFCKGRCAHWPEAPGCAREYQAMPGMCGGLVHGGGLASGGAGVVTESGGVGGAAGSTGGAGGAGGETMEPAPTAPTSDAGVAMTKTEGGCACHTLGGATERSAPTGVAIGALFAALLCGRHTRRAKRIAL